MRIRSREPELIDLGPNFYTQKEYSGCLDQLSKIGKYLGAQNIMLKELINLPYTINSILDVGCGGGAFTVKLAENFKETFVLGIDTNSEAINYANSLSKLKNLNFELRNNPKLNEPEKSFDLITSTLVFHHLSDEEIIEFLIQAKKIARKAIIINDLHRNWIAYFSFYLMSPIFFNNRLTMNDGLLSIKKSFKKQDWIHYLKAAEISNSQYSIKWYYPFRWIVRINL